MNPDLISKDDLIVAGWKNRQIEAVFDEPDETGPSGHWLNSSGKPYYHKDRVAVAAYRIGLTSERPSDELWAKWECSKNPTSSPELTFDFHRLAEKFIPNARRKFWSLRLSHPLAGRRGGSRGQEILLIEEALIKMIKFNSGTESLDAEKLNQYLSDPRFQNADSLGPHWPTNIAVRRAHRASYVSKATGNKFLQSCHDAIVLIHAGLLLDEKSEKLDLVDLLISAPMLRFDRRDLSNS